MSESKYPDSPSSSGFPRLYITSHRQYWCQRFVDSRCKPWCPEASSVGIQRQCFIRALATFRKRVSTEVFFPRLLVSTSQAFVSGNVRYTHRHSIIHTPDCDSGQRLSIMVRVSGHVFDSVESTTFFEIKDLPAAAMGSWPVPNWKWSPRVRYIQSEDKKISYPPGVAMTLAMIFDSIICPVVYVRNIFHPKISRLTT